MFGKGISREGDILDLASKIDIVKKSGAWYAYEGDKIGQGRENAKSYLESHPEVMEEIERKVRAYYHLDGTEPEDEKKSDPLQKNVRGCVKDEKGTPLPGVTVMLKGANLGVATDVDGNYSLSFLDKKNLIILFSFVGM